MANLTEEFKKLWKNQVPDSGLLVPLLVWCSNKDTNIEECQKINSMFFIVDKDVLTRKLTLNNKVRHFIAYPKSLKEDEKTKFFYKDIGTRFKWTKRETFINEDVLAIESLKEIIATDFAYSKEERKLIKKL